MSQNTALAVTAGVIGGIATIVFLNIAGLLIWAAFVALACFFLTGGDQKALQTTIVSNIFGVILAWVVALILVNVGVGASLPTGVFAGIVVGLAIVVIVLAANVPLLASVPGTVLGFATAFAFLVQTPEMMSTAQLTGVSLSNALIGVSASMAIGAILGFVIGQVTAMLAKPAAAASPVSAS